MIAEAISTLAQELLTSTDPAVTSVGKRIIAYAESAAELERDYVKLLSAAKAVVERTKGSVDELVALANLVERREVRPVDGA